VGAGRLDSTFSPDDLAAIAAAVHDVESRSPGEIVPYAADRSDAYPEAAWITATLGALLGGLAAAVADGLSGGALEPPGPLWLAGPPIVGAALGYLLGAAWPALRIRLVHADVVEHRVRQRALAAFVEQEVFRTEARTGILLFLSLLERRVIVLADTGIAARVPQQEWDAIVGGVVAGMRRGQAGPALAEAIRRCGHLLAAHDLRRRPDDRDELPDELRRRSE
jgi:putative membrane protein